MAVSKKKRPARKRPTKKSPQVPRKFPDLRAHLKRVGRIPAEYALVLLTGACALVIAWHQGLVALVVEADASHISVVIVAVFLLVATLGGLRARELSVALEVVGAYKALDPVAARALETRLSARVAFMARTSSLLVTLGLIGTVIGFIVALSGVDPAMVGNVNAIGPMVGSLVEGMGIALYTTLVGAMFGIWTALLHAVLAAGATRVYLRALVP